MRSLGLAVVACAFLTACVGLERDEVVGRYVIEYPYGYGREELVLRPDGTYTQEVVLRQGTVKQTQGKWEFARRGFRDTAVVLHDAMLVINADGVFDPDFWPPKPGLCGFPVYKDIKGEVHILQNILLEELTYHKIEPGK